MFTLLKNLVVIVFCVVVVVSIWPQFTENIDIVRPYVEQGLSWITAVSYTHLTMPTIWSV